MSIQAITSPIIYGGSGANGGIQTRQSLRNLESGIANNNLQEAKQAYSELQTAAPQGSGSAAVAFRQVGQALQDGDIGAAGSNLRSFVQTEGQIHQAGADIRTIREALTTSNLNEARSAFASLESVAGQLRPGPQISQDLHNLGQAIQNGNFSNASAAFAALLHDLPSEGSTTTSPPNPVVSVTA
jgi:hypothetical protein